MTVYELIKKIVLKYEPQADDEFAALDHFFPSMW